MSAGKWRLLEVGETIQEGDQWHDHKTNLWAFAHQGVGDAVQTIDGPVRRRMTPAEEHAEELLDMVSVARVIIQKLWDDAEPMREWDPKIHAWLESAANLPTYLP